MSILLAHELGHYIVGRRHGLDMSPPLFIPFPVAFGTFGAIIRLRSLPSSRSALLEMGAAGPLAGAILAIFFIAIGLPGTEASPPPPPPPPPEAAAEALPALLEIPLDALDAALSWGPIGAALDALSPPPPEDHFPVVIFNNPPVMDLLGAWLLGAPPGRFDVLTPAALAGWVGCLLTAINLLPIGQLDGGHVANALHPARARAVSRGLVFAAIAAGVLWSGWAFWGLMLLAFRAWESLPVPAEPGLTRRARSLAVAALVAFALTFMPRPVEMDALPYGAAPPEAP